MESFQRECIKRRRKIPTLFPRTIYQIIPRNALLTQRAAKMGAPSNINNEKENASYYSVIRYLVGVRTKRNGTKRNETTVLPTHHPHQSNIIVRGWDPTNIFVRSPIFNQNKLSFLTEYGQWIGEISNRFSKILW